MPANAIATLLAAAARGDLSAVEAALAAEPGLVSRRGVLDGHSGQRTALHFAVGGGHEAVVALLLDQGADPNIRCEGDWATPLHFAAEKENLGIIRRLIEHGADPIGAGDYHELEVIGWATCFGSGRQDVVDYLLAHGARHTIFSAVAVGDTGAIRVAAARAPADLDRRMDLTNRRRRPLHLAVAKRQPEALATLLELGAPTESLDEAGLTALDQAALMGAPELAERLLARSAEVRLPAAVALRRREDVERLMREDPEGLRPGHRWGRLIIRAAEESSGEVVEALIGLGADVNVRDDPKTAVDAAARYAPLHGAASRGNLEAAAVLLRHGADPNARDDKYCGTPAGWANHFGHAAARDLILAGPIDLFQALSFDLWDRLPEILARDPGALERPFAAYASCQPLEHAWWPAPWCTPLAWVALQGRIEAVQALLHLGANATVRGPDQRPLADLVRERGHDEVARLLTRQGPDSG